MYNARRRNNSRREKNTWQPKWLPRDFWFLLLCVHYRINACLFLVFAHSFVPNDAVNKREERIVFTDTNVRAGVDFRTSLADENVTCEHRLTVATLRAKSFRLAISTVVRGTRTFLMSE